MYVLFDSIEILRVPNGKYKYWFTRKDINNEKRVSAYLDYIWWWLRSPGRKQVKAVYVHGEMQLEWCLSFSKSGCQRWCRPALWMKL